MIRFARFKSRNKFHVAPAAERTYEGILFASKKEMEHYKRLRLREAIGEITDLKRQVPFKLEWPDGNAIRTPKGYVMRYISDFTYKERGTYHVIDTKGFDLNEGRIKRQLAEIIHGITVEIV